MTFLGFWPTPVDESVRGQLSSVLAFFHMDYALVEAVANIAFFVPLGVASALATPRLSWWLIGGLGLLCSCCIELGQFAFLVDRFPSLVDLVTNTVGAAAGAYAARRHQEIAAYRSQGTVSATAENERTTETSA